MGKLALLLVTTALVGGTVLITQSHQTNVLTNERHAERQQEMLAREIARSGYNYMLAAAREYERNNPGTSVEQVVSAVNAMGENGWHSGTYKGGKYKTKLTVASHSSYGVTSTGTFERADHTTEGEEVKEVHLAVGTLVTPDTSSVTTTVEHSNSDYCSALYVQRLVPKNNNGHGNNVDGVDSSNPGGSKDGMDSDPTVDDEKLNGNISSRYRGLTPELLFASGKNRDGVTSTYALNLSSGTLVNLYLAVDKDCSSQGDATLSLTSSTYDYILPALTASAANLDEMLEAKNAIIERNQYNASKFRIAFEEKNTFSDAQHADVKANGYGLGTWKKLATGSYSYGGTGWTLRNALGYFTLSDRSSMPDFNDQVFEIQINH